ncbi:MAG: radical SAM protein [Methanobacteriota archaeon]
MRALILYLTNQCNMRCTYCYVTGQEKPIIMDFQTAKNAVDISIKGSVKELSLTFHGGEPSLVFNLMKQIFNYAKMTCNTKKIKLSAICISNGTYDEKFVKWIKINDIKIYVTIDGPSFIHNRQRPFKDGTASLTKVIRGINLLKKNKVKISCGTTITKYSAPYMVDIIKYIHKLGIMEYNIGPLIPLGRGQCDNIPNGFTYIKGYKRCLKYANNNDFFIQTIGQSFDLLCTKCSASTQSIMVILPGGEVTACHMIVSPYSKLSDKFIIGNIHDNKLIIHQNKVKALKRSIHNITGCKECYAKWTCGGNCMLYPLVENKSLNEPAGENICNIEKELLKFSLLSLINNDRSFWQKDYVIKEIKI